MSTTPQDEDVQPGNRTSNVALMWMHLTWWCVQPAAIIIWFVIKNKHPQATVHGKNILNAFITEQIAVFAVMPILAVMVYHVDIQMLTGYTIPEFVLITLSVILSMIVCAYWFILVYSLIYVVIATRKGKILPYFWAIRFFKI
jgi:uncharacterized Tic20 family protein